MVAAETKSNKHLNKSIIIVQNKLVNVSKKIAVIAKK